MTQTRHQPTPASSAATHVTGRRVLATVVDGIVFGAAYVVLATLTGTIVSTGPWSWQAQLPTAATVVYVVAVVAYYLVLEGLFGQTIGKLLCGIRVIDERTGEGPGFGAVVLRTLLRLVDGLFSYLIAFVAVVSTTRRQRLGDMAAHTQVVRTRG